MAKDKKNNKKFDYKGYVSNLGKVGTFYKDGKDSKGVEGTLVSIAENGVYAKVKDSIFPRLFARADFGSEATFKMQGKTYKIVEVKNGKGSKSKDNDSYGSFSGKNGAKKAKSLIKFLNKIDGLDQHDDDDWKEIVEASKKL